MWYYAYEREDKMRTINFSIFANNPIDYIDKELHDISGNPVRITQDMRGEFNLFIGDKQEHYPSNIQLCYRLNMIEVGY